MQAKDGAIDFRITAREAADLVLRTNFGADVERFLVIEFSPPRLVSLGL